MRPPLIGITSSIRVESTGWTYCVSYAPIATAIARAGGLPVIVPSLLDRDALRGIFERLDGVMVPGGGDVNPNRYGAVQHPRTDRIDDKRDEAELTLARWAVEDDRPLFGICRGHQVVNVATGGTLVQDIPSQLTTTIRHDYPSDIPRSQRAHEVKIEAGSRLAQIIGKPATTVNSLHHQSADHHGPAVCFSAFAPDGVVEALEIPDRRFALSVQWHPEDMVDDEAAQALFRAFVDAARKWANR